MKLLDKDNTITYRKFKCLRSNDIYEVVQSTCVGRYVFNSEDTVVRDSDKARRTFARIELGDRFDNIEPIHEIDYSHFKKRKKK